MKRCLRFQCFPMDIMNSVHYTVHVHPMFCQGHLFFMDVVDF